ncbi:LPS export ABC transporter periplasmic protein LptC [Paenirhodobacter sp. CAU 1674]|jgi:lipopolysaccharide export system protein LptC|uniref:LPS export ABC transporter periplasmic protein LptC n=1 Tax=Paenirhodobacter sp. CAU 1674 TaxID=3032596 RepID=UPI0023DC0846|nr:LPS export ABC transporter periplasmic protein LptC [Paenirhodobacter sp. CAU 1674]MDF2140326.1 hypothetical protein [Paenirhodobacter sp. CAU 1674]
MHYDNRHSALVVWAKIALPLAALGLLSTMFLFSGKVDPGAARLYAEVDVDALAREPRMTAPQFAGMTQEGAALTVTAQTAMPDPNGGGATAERLAAKLESTGGLVTELTSKTGRLDPAQGQILLSDGVGVQTSAGYRLATDRIEIATDHTSVIAPGPVQGEAPFGTISADSMALTAASADGPHDLVFNGHVKLVYQPKE